MGTRNEEARKWYPQAQIAAAKIGWDARVILSQWQLESAHFSSNNFKKNNNIAGQTWFPGMPISMRGTARSKEEGSYYIKYDDPVSGYTDFVLKNGRYSDVREKATVYEQFAEIKKSGWATDPNYVKSLWAIHQANIKAGIYEADDSVIISGNLNGDTGKLQGNTSNSLSSSISTDNIFDAINDLETVKPLVFEKDANTIEQITTMFSWGVDNTKVFGFRAVLMILGVIIIVFGLISIVKGSGASSIPKIGKAEEVTA